MGIKEFKKGDIVKLNDTNLKIIGYDVEGFLNANLQDVNFEIGHIYTDGGIHYYKEELFKSGLYSRDILNDKHVYEIYCHLNGRTISYSVIDDDMIFIQSKVMKKTIVPNSILNNILSAYVLFHERYDLKTNRGNILDDIKKGKPNKKTLINIIDEVNSLPCYDDLYDKYMNKESNEWLFNIDNEDFCLVEYINNTL